MDGKASPGGKQEQSGGVSLSSLRRKREANGWWVMGRKLAGVGPVVAPSSSSSIPLGVMSSITSMNVIACLSFLFLFKSLPMSYSSSSACAWLNVCVSLAGDAPFPYPSLKSWPPYFNGRPSPWQLARLIKGSAHVRIYGVHKAQSSSLLFPIKKRRQEVGPIGSSISSIGKTTSHFHFQGPAPAQPRRRPN